MYSAIQTGMAHGMQTLEQCLQTLVNRGLITREDAMQKSSNKQANF